MKLTRSGLLNLLLTLGAIANGLGLPIAFKTVALVGMGLSWALFGNYLGKLTRNFYLGIRTPWTLVSDEVWTRTHRLAAWLAVASGLGLATVAMFWQPKGLWIPHLVIVIGVPAAYSYFLYQRLERSAAGKATPEER